MNRAFLVGINAYTSAPLNGCVNDVRDMASFLVEKCAFSHSDIRLLVDARATKSAIVERLEWLINGVKAGDRILFHYSGHGAQVPTRNTSGEVDGLDEVICPVDFDWSDGHMIRDKEFHQIFSSVPSGVKFAWISDSCHSGDLSKEFPRIAGQAKTISPPVDINWRLQTAKEKKIRAMGMGKAASESNVALISGCKSDQTSSDASFGGRPNGALSYFLLKELLSASGLSKPLTSVVTNVNSSLKMAGYSQSPQLEGCEILMGSPFLG